MFTLTFKFLLYREACVASLANRILCTWDGTESVAGCLFIKILTLSTLMISPHFLSTRTGPKIFADGTEEIKKCDSSNRLVFRYLCYFVFGRCRLWVWTVTPAVLTGSCGFPQIS